MYFSIPTKASNPTGIAIDKQDRVWFTEMDKNKIGRFDPTAALGSQFAEFLLPNGGSPSGIAIDPDTGIVWFTEFRGNRIGRLDPAVATPNTVNGIMEFQIPTLNSGPTSIVIDTDKIVWFSETSSKKIGKLTPPP
jgi:virginiamycin B lyase